MEDKFCNKCSTTKLLDLFYKNKRNKDGHRSECKECGKKENAIFNANNPGYAKKYAKKYAETHKEEIKKRMSEYTKNPEKKQKKSEYAKKYAETHKEEIKKRMSEYYKKYHKKYIQTPEQKEKKRISAIKNIDRYVSSLNKYIKNISESSNNDDDIFGGSQ